jgi:hypothetical protein
VLYGSTYGNLNSQNSTMDAVREALITLVSLLNYRNTYDNYLYFDHLVLKCAHEERIMR